MKRVVTLAVVVAFVSGPLGAAAMCVPDLSKTGYDLVLEIAGYVIQRKVKTLEGKSVCAQSPDGVKAEVVFDTIYSEACNVCCPRLRLISFVKVNRQSGAVCTSTNAAISISADLTVSQAPKTLLNIKPVPETLTVAADPPDARAVEEFLKQVAPEIAKTLTTDVTLDGMDVFVRARPANEPPLAAYAYELGLQWVLQVYGPVAAGQGPPPGMFLIGDSFTVVMSRDMVRNLAESDAVTGRFPKRLNENGLVDAEGAIAVTGISADLDCNLLLIVWHGIRPDGSKVDVVWRMGFVSTADGLSLDIQELTVDGQMKAIPEGVEIINPVDALIRTIATGSSDEAVFLSPLGRVRLTTGLINPLGMIVGGRA